MREKQLQKWREQQNYEQILRDKHYREYRSEEHKLDQNEGLLNNITGTDNYKDYEEDPNLNEGGTEHTDYQRDCEDDPD